MKNVPIDYLYKPTNYTLKDTTTTWDKIYFIQYLETYDEYVP